MTDEELARIKTAWSGYPERTHSEGCREWHPECAVVGLVGEVEWLRGQVDDVAHALDAEQDEVVRLREGVREHRDATVKAMSHDWELWALLEENHNG